MTVFETVFLSREIAAKKSSAFAQCSDVKAQKMVKNASIYIKILVYENRQLCVETFLIPLDIVPKGSETLGDNTQN